MTNNNEWVDKAKDLAEQGIEFAKDNPEQVRGALDGVEDFVNDKTGGKFTEQINQASEWVESQLGADESQAKPETADAPSTRPADAAPAEDTAPEQSTTPSESTIPQPPQAPTTHEAPAPAETPAPSEAPAPPEATEAPEVPEAAEPATHEAPAPSTYGTEPSGTEPTASTDSYGSPSQPSGDVQQPVQQHNPSFGEQSLDEQQGQQQ